MKKAAALVLCAALLCAQLPAALAAGSGDVISISTAKELSALAENCVSDEWSKGKTIVLEADINLTGLDFEPVPLMNGTFDGQGHSIIGLRFDGAGSTQGLFRAVLKDGAVKNLSVSGSLNATGNGEGIGGIAGVNYGTITDCRFEGSVSGLKAVGGIAGKNCEGGVISDCTAAGSVQAQHRVGGIAGENGGTLDGCTNTANINTVYVSPAEEKTLSSFDVSRLTTLSEEDVIDITDIGGVAGLNTAAISRCVNTGSIGYPHTGYNVGGIAGRQSGRIADCANSGEVTGRKDVGGIAGQMEPYAAWSFTGSGLANVQAQLAQLEAAMNDMLGGIGASLADARYLMQAAIFVAGDTRDIINSLFVMPIDTPADGLLPTETTPSEWLERNSAAADAISANFQEMIEILYALSQSVSGETLIADMQNVLAQLMNVSGAMAEMLYGIGSTADMLEVDDVSERADRPHGVISGCRSYAAVTADTNAGGIAGLIALDISFDREDRLDISSFVLGNGRYEVFARVTGCENYAEISAGKVCAGGIAGRMDYGSVYRCIAAGTVSAADKYAGGIAGYSSGTLRECAARANLSAGSYIGGIAGLGQNIADCRAMPHIEQRAEFSGSIAGYAGGTVSGNKYSDSVIGGVDGFSFGGQADSMDYAAFSALPDTPDCFKKISVRFVAEGKTVSTVEIPFGGSVDSLPEVPDKGGMYWQWNEFDADAVYYSITVSGRYVRPVTTVATGGEEPLFLAEGSFREGQELLAVPFTPGCAALGIEEDAVLAAYTVKAPGYTGELTVRMRAPEGGRLYVLSDGAAVSHSFTRDGSYIVFALENGGSVIYAEAERTEYLWPAIGGGAAVIAAAGTYLLLRRKKKRAAPAESGEQAE